MSRSFVLEHVPALRRYARVLTGDAWAADDLVQDTLERACRKWGLWRPGTDLRAWLFTLMHNLYLNQRRGAAARAVLVPIDDLQAELAAPAAGRDAAIDLQRCLQQLPDDQRAALLLVALEELPYADAARVLGVPPGTLMSRLSRARARLRELMEAPARVNVASATGAPPALRRLK